MSGIRHGKSPQRLRQSLPEENKSATSELATEGLPADRQFLPEFPQVPVLGRRKSVSLFLQSHCARRSRGFGVFGMIMQRLDNDDDNFEQFPTPFDAPSADGESSHMPGMLYRGVPQDISRRMLRIDTAGSQLPALKGPAKVSSLLDL